jgi:hypothetical protein
MLEQWIKRHLFDCKDIGKTPKLNAKPFWDEPTKETIEKRIKELQIEHHNKQAE